MPTLMTSLLHTRPATSASTCVSNPACASAAAKATRRRCDPSAMAMCVGPFPACRMRPGPRKVAPCDVTPAAVRSTPKCFLRIASLPRPFWSVSAMVPGPARGANCRAASSVDVDFTNTIITSEPRVSSGSVVAAGRHGEHLGGARLLDGQAGAADGLDVLREDVVEHHVVAGPGQHAAEQGAHGP